MPKPSPTRYRATNWSDYNAALRQRGSLSVWFDVRSRVEAQMNRLNLFGERIISRDPNRQTAEIQNRIAIMNRFSALGRAEVEATA